MEERLQQFEKKGIEATILVQRAARIVARENRLLRELLYSKGISEAEINQHVNYMIRPAAIKEERIIDRQIANSPPAYEEALGHTAQKEIHTTNRSNSTEQDG